MVVRPLTHIFDCIATKPSNLFASHYPVFWKEEDAPMLTPVLISVIVTLIVVGLLLYLIGLIPMDGTIKQIIRVVVIIAVIIWLLQTFGLLGSLGLHH
jgi:hypothetical protein